MSANNKLRSSVASPARKHRSPKPPKKTSYEVDGLGESMDDASINLSNVELQRLESLGIATMSISGSPIDTKVLDVKRSAKKPSSAANAPSPLALKRSATRPKRVRNKFSQAVYEKAAKIFASLSEDNKVLKKVVDELTFDDDFESRRAYSLAFAAKKYTSILKEVLEDSSFFSYHYKLEQHDSAHDKILVILLDFYEHGFRFRESSQHGAGARLVIVKPDEDDPHFEIYEIQEAFIAHSVKLASAFARCRIEACALSIEGLLPAEVAERSAFGARQPLYARVNTKLRSVEDALTALHDDGFAQVATDVILGEIEEHHVHKIFHPDPHFPDDAFIFSRDCKDDVYNSDMVVDYELIPESKSYMVLVALVRSIMKDLAEKEERALALMLDVPEGARGHDVLLTHAELGGMLSSHLASLLSDDNKLIICSARYKEAEIKDTLKDMGVTNYELISEEFVGIPASDERLERCKIIICNPPSSLSGVVNAVDYVLQEGVNFVHTLAGAVSPAKIRGLVVEQDAALTHALTFPLCQFVIYTTASINAAENEALIAEILSRYTVSCAAFEVTSFLPEMTDTLHRDVHHAIVVANGTDDTFEEPTAKYLKIPPSSLMDGFFLAMLKKKEQESARDIIDRAKRKGLVNKVKKTHSKKKEHALAKKVSSGQSLVSFDPSTDPQTSHGPKFEHASGSSEPRKASLKAPHPDNPFTATAKKSPNTKKKSHHK